MRRLHWAFLKKCPFGKSRGDRVPSKSLLLTQGPEPLHESETQISNTRVVDYHRPDGCWREMRDWVQQKEEEGCQEQEGRTVSQEKRTARCCRRLERPGHKTDPRFRVGDTLPVTTEWRGARNSLVAGKGFLGMREQSQNKIGSLPCKFSG